MGEMRLIDECKRYDSEQNVRALLGGDGCNVNEVDETGCSALHFAAENGNATIVGMLLRAGANVHLRQEANQTALHYCAYEHINDTVQIGRMLINAGANINARAINGYTPLMIAARHGSAAFVSMLLEFEDIDVFATSDGTCANVMHFACANRMDGHAIIRVLMETEYGRSLMNTRDKEDRSPLLIAYSCGAKMLKGITPFHADGLRTETLPVFPAHSCPDPIGALTERSLFDSRVLQPFFAGAHARKNTANFTWAMLRRSDGIRLDGSGNFDVFNTMSECKNNHKLWRLVVGELLITRHPMTEDTLFHVAARSNSMFGVRACMANRLNPLLRNKNGELALDCTTDNEIRNAIQAYSLWRPKRKITQWFGPYFLERATTFLLVCHRWQQSTTVSIPPRDVRYMIIQKLASLEYTFVSSRK